MGENTTPALLVIFGITGDLAKRKLLPALYHLMRDNLMHPETRIIGVTRQHLTEKDILKDVDKFARTHERTSELAIKQLEQAFELFPMDLAASGDYRKLKAKLDGIEKASKHQFQRLYYLSIPPAVFDDVVALMGENGLAKRAGSKMSLPGLLIEKPFGYDLKSAKNLVKSTKRYFSEEQIYRIDHYLAKEMAQNILNFRFQNDFFVSIWSHHHISKVIITAHEKIGIEGRANFYEQTGALRDLIQSHLLQLMALIAMERPKNLRSSRSVHRERVKLMKSIIPPKQNEIDSVAIRGQYQSYRKEINDKKSATETYAAIKIWVENERWQNVPFIIKTGKALSEKCTHIDVHFGNGNNANILTFRLQPNEGIHLGMQVKKPGHEQKDVYSDLDFSYQRSFKTDKSPDAYERVMLDAIRQDQTLFASSGEVLASWRVIEPILQEWSKSAKDLKKYKTGSHGPLEGAMLKKFIKS